MDTLRAISLLAATVTMGLMSGMFGLYQHTIMPGLKTTDDRTFVGAFQALDRKIINPWFMLDGFVGALIFTVLALIFHLGEDTMPWIVGAGVLYLVAVIITMAVNVPLNDALKAAGDPDEMDLPKARAEFNETRWSNFNLVRTLLSTAGFVLLAWALVVYGRS